MGLLEIKKFPEKILYQKSASVKEITQKELTLFADMFATMRQHSGIGLAAPQIGVSRRLIVVDIGQGPLKLANPEIIQIKGKDRMEEGCLSVPDALVTVVRPYEVIMQALNGKGKPVEFKARGLLARVLLHEIDHLNGKLIIDYLNFFKKLQFKLNYKVK